MNNKTFWVFIVVWLSALIAFSLVVTNYEVRKQKDLLEKVEARIQQTEDKLRLEFLRAAKK